MTLYAKIDSDKTTILEFVDVEEDHLENCNTDPERGKPFLLPVVEVKPDLKDNERYTGSSYVVEASQVVKLWAVEDIPPATSAWVADIMDAFSDADYAAIQTAIGANIGYKRWWDTLLSRVEPVNIANQRFIAAWGALAKVLGPQRCDELLAAIKTKVF